ncbi:MAG: SGNH/GDSL hydrolase family protein [Bacilli bacterium]|nr:SGNH/GDSL hydrolase family protein [Bacilli bacterium]
MKRIVILLSLGLLTASCGSSNGGASSILASSAEESSSTISIEYEVPSAEDVPQNVSAGDARYDVSKVVQKENHPLKGKTIYWLGSSVTYGSASSGQSMADYLAAKSGCISKKDAVSGTTMYNDGKSSATGANSYVNRLKNSKVFDPDNDWVDAFVCQISTNDCTNDRLDKRGSITADDVTDMDSFDVATTLGAIEYIIAYAYEVLYCPVYFYSGAYFSDGTDKAQRQNNNPKGSEYGKLVDQVLEIAAKWNSKKGYDVKVIDLYHDKDFNAVASDAYYAWATNDPIHPRKAGYLQWWTPYFEAKLIEDLG